MIQYLDCRHFYGLGNEYGLTVLFVHCKLYPLKWTSLFLKTLVLLWAMFDLKNMEKEWKCFDQKWPPDQFWCTNSHSHTIQSYITHVTLKMRPIFYVNAVHMRSQDIICIT